MGSDVHVRSLPLAREASLKKTRRIEITAFRRTTRVFADGSDVRAGDQPAPSIDVTSSSEERSAQFIDTDLLEAILSSDDARSRELTKLIEALVISGGDSARAAQQVGLSRNRFYSKLRSLGLSIRNLRTNLNLLR